MSVTNEVVTAGIAKKKPVTKDPTKMMSHQANVNLPSYIGQSITSLLVFIMAATMRG